MYLKNKYSIYYMRNLIFIIILLLVIVFSTISKISKAQLLSSTNYYPKNHNDIILLHNDKKKAKQKNKEESGTSIDNYFKGWNFGMNFGVYFPNSATANYYDGQQNDILKKVIFDYPQNYENIKNYFNSDFNISEYPLKMHYNNPIYVGFIVKYGLSVNTNLFAEMNYAKLTTNDAFTIKLFNAPNGITQPIQIGTLAGSERRTDINLGLRENFGEVNIFMPYAETSFNINSVKVLEAKAMIAGQTFDINNPNFNPNLQYNTNYNQYIGGVGYGINISGGLQIIFNEKYSFDIGATLSKKQIKIPDNDKYLTQYIVYLRIMFHNTKHDETSNQDESK
jgi:hypothetical protein